MDVFPDLLPPSFTAKVEPLAQDSRKQKQQENSKSKIVETATGAEVELDEADGTVTKQFKVDRRLGKDRRHQRTNRGRWLESRDRNDRRTSNSDIFVKV